MPFDLTNIYIDITPPKKYLNGARPSALRLSTNGTTPKQEPRRDPTVTKNDNDSPKRIHKQKSYQKRHSKQRRVAMQSTTPANSTYGRNLSRLTSTNRLPKKPTRPEPKDVKLYYEEYYVEKIIGKRITRHGPEYLVKWWYFPESQSTWEREDCFIDRTMIETYEDLVRLGLVPEPEVVDKLETEADRCDVQWVRVDGPKPCNNTEEKSETELEDDDTLETASFDDIDKPIIEMFPEDVSEKIESVLDVAYDADQNLHAIVQYEDTKEGRLPITDLVLAQYYAWLCFKLWLQEELLEETEKEPCEPDVMDPATLPESYGFDLFKYGSLLSVTIENFKLEDHDVFARLRLNMMDRIYRTRYELISFNYLTNLLPNLVENHMLNLIFCQALNLYDELDKSSEKLKLGHNSTGNMILPTNQEIDVCDCLLANCPGCMEKCKDCDGYKCSFECQRERGTNIVLTWTRSKTKRRPMAVRINPLIDNLVIHGQEDLRNQLFDLVFN